MGTPRVTSGGEWAAWMRPYTALRRCTGPDLVRPGIRPAQVALTDGHPAGPQAPDPLGPQHAQDHEGDGARRRRAPAPGGGAHPGDAAVRRAHARADDRHGPRRGPGVEPPAPARGARRGRARPPSSPSPATGAWPAPSTRRSSRRAFSLEREVRASGRRAALARRRQEGPLDAVVSPLRARRRLGRLHRPARLLGRRRHRAPRRSSSSSSGEVDSVVLVYNRYYSPLTQKVETIDLLPIPRSAMEEEEEKKTPYEIALEGDTSTSRSRRRSSSACCPRTSRPRSTAPCSSPPPRSSAPG